jgi:hypothetical protein
MPDYDPNTTYLFFDSPVEYIIIDNNNNAYNPARQLDSNSYYVYFNNTPNLNIDFDTRKNNGDYSGDGDGGVDNLYFKKIILGKNVTTINNNAFYNNKNIISVTIPDSVTNIASNAFAGTSLKSVYTNSISSTVYTSGNDGTNVYNSFFGGPGITVTLTTTEKITLYAQYTAKFYKDIGETDEITSESSTGSASASDPSIQLAFEDVNNAIIDDIHKVIQNLYPDIETNGIPLSIKIEIDYSTTPFN